MVCTNFYLMLSVSTNMMTLFLIASIFDLLINAVREHVIDVEVLKNLGDSFFFYIKSMQFVQDLTSILGYTILILEYDRISHEEHLKWQQPDKHQDSLVRLLDIRDRDADIFSDKVCHVF